MQITLSFEPSEIPEIAAHLAKLASGDFSGLLAFASAARTEAAAVHPVMRAPAAAPATEQDADPLNVKAQEPSAPADVAPAEKPRRGRKPKKADPHVTPVPQADMAPVDVAPETTPAAPLAVAPTPAKPSSDAAGVVPSVDDLRAAFVRANERNVSEDDMIDLLARFGVEKISKTPEAKRAAMIEALDALGA